MASNVDTIREFLVGLGFKVDEAGQKRFVDGVENATVKVVKLGAAVATTAAAVVAGVAKIADQMEGLYFASLRTKATVENIQALGFAAGQMGSSAEAARGSLESLARFMRNSPGAEGLLHSIGVQTRDANGALRDTTEIMGDLGARFAQMPYYLSNAYAQALGIDEKTLMAMREGMEQFSNEYKEMLAKAGMDSQEAAKSSHEFMNEVRSLGAAFVILGQKVAATLTGKLAGDLRRFRDGVIHNFGRVAGIVEKVARGVLLVADVVSTLALRGMQAIGAVVDWFNGLDGTVKTIIETVAALGIAWKLLSAGFLATPIGRIVALGTAILALYDDYKVWKEGGKTLIDWSQWEPGIKAAGAGIRWLKDLLSDMMYRAIAAVDAINAIWHRDWNRLKFAVGEFLAGQGKPYGQPEAPSAAEAGTPQGAPAAPAAPAAGAPQAPAASGAGARQPRGIRNNNPGNLNYVGQPGATRESGPNGRFAVFQTAEEGLVALARQLRLYAQRGINSVRAIISKFAPPTENDTQAYIESVSKRLGVDANASLNVNDPRVMQGLMDAIIKVENGRNPYSTEQLASASAVRAAGAQAAAQAPVTLTQETTIHVTGGGDPQSTAQAVAQAQNGVNQRLVRNMRTAVQ
uniref:Putative bacteriophage protein n=1 Tax=Ralstonia pickettii (strain 12D) TaxID=428406 RepID=C6BBR9_RALP1